MLGMLEQLEFFARLPDGVYHRPGGWDDLEEIVSNGRAALVTGGSRGIGLGIASHLLEDGYRVAINGVRDADAVAGTLDDLRSAGGDVVYARGSVADRGDREAIVAATLDAFGRIDVLVNNAGIPPANRRDILEAEEGDFDAVLDTNLKGPYFLTQAVARAMVSQREADPDARGVIVNIGSMSATVVSTNRGEYCLSKAATAMATQLWAVRLAEFGIDCYEVRPGIVATDMTAGVSAKYDRLIADGLTVERRWGTPDDVGSAVAALVRGDIPYATGQVLHIDGGLTTQRL